MLRISTPQIINCVKRAEDQIGWNWRQFRRRVRRWVVLPEWNTRADLEAVARKIIPGVSKAGIDLALGYAELSLNESPSRDVSGLADVALEARLIAEDDGRDKITFEDIERAITEHLQPSDQAFSESMSKAEAALGKRSRNRILKTVNHPLNDDLKPELETAEEAHSSQTFTSQKPTSRTDLPAARARPARQSLVAA